MIPNFYAKVPPRVEYTLSTLGEKFRKSDAVPSLLI